MTEAKDQNAEKETCDPTARVQYSESLQYDSAVKSTEKQSEPQQQGFRILNPCKIEQRLSATVSISGGKWTDPGSQNLAGKATTPAADKLSYDFTRTYDLSFGGDPDDIHAGWKVR